MDNLVCDLEELEIRENDIENDAIWETLIISVQKAWVPQKLINESRPYEEKDFREYRMTVNRDLEKILKLLRALRQKRDNDIFKIDWNRPVMVNVFTSLVLLIGEQSEESVWNSAETVSLTKDIETELCSLLNCASISSMFGSVSCKLSSVLLALRPKVLKDTWKTYPAAVTCYMWLLRQVEVPNLVGLIGEVLPTALIIFDDYVPDNKLAGLECIYQILGHLGNEDLVKTGYAEVLYDSLKRLTIQRDVRYIIPLYTCIGMVLASMEFSNNSANMFEWTKRDDIIATLLENMECELDMLLRHAYMSSLPHLLTNVGCAKWCEVFTRVLVEYCGNHTNLRTLKVTLQVAELTLPIFQPRISAYCDLLYTAFFRLHVDLMETPVFDKKIIESLERCICLLYKLTPNIGEAIMRDDRMRSIIKNSPWFDEPMHYN